MRTTQDGPDLRLDSTHSFLKGEGTANDFVVMADLDGVFDPSPDFIRAVCDRHRGVGADGVLRIVRNDPGSSVARFFMDYRNADGTVAEMCGNGARVFALALGRTGLETASEFLIQTRGGLRQVRHNSDGSISVGMGAPRYQDPAQLECDLAPSWGRAVWMPNPHAVFVVTDLDELDLSVPPRVGPGAVFPHGVNVELVSHIGDHHVRMRVFERGVGETMSCGTGACAVAVDSALSCGEGPGDAPWRVDVAGGTLSVEWGIQDIYLTGPAKIVAAGTFDSDWVDSVS